MTNFKPELNASITLIILPRTVTVGKQIYMFSKTKMINYKYNIPEPSITLKIFLTSQIHVGDLKLKIFNRM